jgi:hypothetical protein
MVMGALELLAKLKPTDLCIGVEPYEDSVYVVPGRYFLDGIRAYTAILEAKTFGELEDGLPVSCVGSVMEYVKQRRFERTGEREFPRDTPYSPSDYRGLSEYFDHRGHGLVEPVLAVTQIVDGEEFTDSAGLGEVEEQVAVQCDHDSAGEGEHGDCDEDDDCVDDFDDEDRGSVYVATASQGLSQTFITLPSEALDAVVADYRRFGVELVGAGSLLEYMYDLYERLP